LNILQLELQKHLKLDDGFDHLLNAFVNLQDFVGAAAGRDLPDFFLLGIHQVGKADLLHGYGGQQQVDRIFKIKINHRIDIRNGRK